MKTVRCAIIGTGMMGKEFASSVMRWSALSEMDVVPEIVSVCSKSLKPSDKAWFSRAVPTITQMTTDYREVLANPLVEVVYCAVPHHLHETLYTECIEAGKHLFAEKPFGIDLNAGRAIMKSIDAHPEVFVRCTSQFPFAPGVQRLCSMVENNELGTIIEVDAGFLHSSDLNPDKPINWKRKTAYCGSYGCMGDLGIHITHVPFRAGWRPKNVRAVLSNIMKQRPDGKGGMEVCDTWDNAVLLCEAEDADGNPFPMTLRTQRISPGEKNTWYITVKGTHGAAHFSTKQMNTFSYLIYEQGEQAWRVVDMGQETAFKTITGDIFEFGMADAFQQMIASFFYEYTHGKRASTFSGCVTPDEAYLSHLLFTAALKSHTERTTEAVHDPSQEGAD